MSDLALQTQLAFQFDRGRPPDLSALVCSAVAAVGGLPSMAITGEEHKLLTPGRPLPGEPPLRPAGDNWTTTLAKLRSVEERRDLGQFFTPPRLVEVMTEWVRRWDPGQVVDAGCGTGRFAIAAATALPQSRVLAIDIDPAATLLCRAEVKRLGLANVEVRCADFLRCPLELDDRPAVFVGNPPYVRHHRLSPELKHWGALAARKLGVAFSALAGLHLYFFLATARHARPGDRGCYLTSAEWLDVRYGKGLRQLLTGVLGVSSLSLLNESAAAFDDAMSSAMITCFEVGRQSRTVRLSVVEDFRQADGPKDSRTAPYDALGDRWSLALRGARRKPRSKGLVRLGEIVRVHRGVATGANGFFVLDGDQADVLGLTAFVKPVITSAKQILESGGEVNAVGRKVLLLLPKSLAEIPPGQRAAVENYLAHGVAQGFHRRYLCQHRKPWWWLGTRHAPPIVASYMARRPPAFALNNKGLHILNIAHGLHPHTCLTAEELRRLVANLNASAADFVGNGRTYQGGLEKFEPREMEALLVPPLHAKG